MSWAALAVGLTTTVVGAGIAAATRPGAPNTPDLGASTRAGILGDLANLPAQRQLEIASRLGTKVDTTTGERVPIYGKQLQVQIRNGTGKNADSNPHWVNATQADIANGGKYYGLANNLNNTITGYENKKISADFTGIGDADLQNQMARNTAQTGLDISREFAPQYIEEAKKQQALADPQGTEARKLLYDRIQSQIARQPDRPVSGLLDQQVSDSLSQGSGLDSSSSALVQKALANRVAMGDAPGADIVGTLTSGPEGDARAAIRRQQALSYIGSGTSPSDVAYRKSEQDKANIGAFLSGQTPEAQFQQLSGAQQGAAPVAKAPSAPNLNPNAGAQGAQNAATAYGNQLGQQSQQANPWFAGLGLAIKGAAAINNGRQGTGFG